jgi:hypothetical protein
MEYLFKGIKTKPLAEHLKMSQSRFSQKMHKKTVNGYKQDFTKDEKIKLKFFLLFLVENIVLEVEKL